MIVFYFLSSVLFLILIHEWGHFAAARFFRVGVETFSIGFGKPLFAYTDTQTGTRWQVGPIPLGGFVALMGEKTAEAAPKSGIPVQGRAFMRAPLHAKIVILLAGVTVNLLFAALAYGWLAYGSANPARPILASPLAGTLALAAGVQSGDEVTALNGESVSSWRDIQMKLLSMDIDSAVELTLARGATQTVVRLAPPRSNPSQPNNSAAAVAAEERLGLRLRALGMSVQGFTLESAAEEAGLQLNDVLTHLDGQPLEHATVLKNALATYDPSLNGVVFDVVRGGKKIQTTVKPTLDAQKTYKLGVQFAPLALLQEHGITAFAAVLHGFRNAYLASWLTVKALLEFLHHPTASEQLAGPMTIAKTAKASADRGWEAALAFLAGLSVSVGVLNLLPVPILDGGQVLYHLARAVLHKLVSMDVLPFRVLQGHKIGLAIEKIWVSVGVAFVVFLTVAAFYTDIMRLLSAQ